MRIGIPSRRSRTDRAIGSEPLAVALAKALAMAEPVEAIEVSLGEAVGLVLAEDVVADVDLPPFDRAAAPGFAVRCDGSAPGTLLRVAPPGLDGGHEVEPGEAARVEPGGPMPVGADAVLGLDEVRPDSAAEGAARVVEILAAPEPGRSVVRRGATMAAGSIVAASGTRIAAGLVPILAAQGCVYPLCYRRVRVAIIAIGGHLVGPADAPVLHHERNASNLAVATLILGAGGMVHDLGAVAEADFGPALHRALNAHLVLILGRVGTEGRLALARAGLQSQVAGVALEPGGVDLRHGVVRADGGRVETHVVGLPLDPVAAAITATLFVRPLLARLQGGDEPASPSLRAVWDASPPAAIEGIRAVPARLRMGEDARLHAQPIVTTGMLGLAHADGIALFPPSLKGEVVTFAPFDGWPTRAGG